MNEILERKGTVFSDITERGISDSTPEFNPDTDIPKSLLKKFDEYFQTYKDEKFSEDEYWIYYGTLASLTRAGIIEKNTLSDEEKNFLINKTIEKKQRYNHEEYLARINMISALSPNLMELTRPQNEEEIKELEYFSDKNKSYKGLVNVERLLTIPVLYPQLYEAISQDLNLVGCIENATHSVSGDHISAGVPPRSLACLKKAGYKIPDSQLHNVFRQSREYLTKTSDSDFRYSLDYFFIGQIIESLCVISADTVVYENNEIILKKMTRPI